MALATFSGFGQLLFFTLSKSGASRSLAALGTKEVSPEGTSSTVMAPFVTHIACPTHSKHCGNAHWGVIPGVWVGVSVH